MRMTFPIISNYLNISRTAEREPLEQRPQPAKLHETSIEQAPRLGFICCAPCRLFSPVKRGIAMP